MTLPKKRSLFLFFLIFSIALVAIYYLKFEKKDNIEESILAPKVEVLDRKVEDFSKKLYFLAKLHSNKSINLISETDGTIKTKKYQIGEYIEKNKVIIQMTDTRKVLELKELEDLLEASKARLDEASSNYKNSITLHEKNIISNKEKETERNEYRSQKSEYDAQKMRYKKVLWEFDNLSVRAPFNGHINKYYFDTGQKISKGVPILEFLDNTLLIGKANISSENAKRIRATEKRLNIRIQDTILTAELLGISRQMSNEAPSYKLEFQIQNEENRLIPGEVVEVEIEISEYKNHISFPSTAIVMEGDKYFLFLEKDNTVKKIQIIPTQLDNQVSIVPQNQIPELHRIIINGQARLEGNEEIRVNE
jgi:membrane fusion protein (multidrug efflux system)